MKNRLSEAAKTQILDLLKTLVRIPSINTGEGQTGIPEEAIAAYIDVFLKGLGMETRWLRMENGRPNLLGRWPGAKGKKVLLLTAHMDTVGVDGMKDPFEPRVEKGKIFGRGTCDTKGSLAVYLWVLKTLAEGREKLDRDVQFLGTCDEENGCVGSTWLADHRLVQADEVIVGEPTQSRIAIAHRGSIVLEFYTTGVSAHSSVPERGDNAIYQMADLIRVLQEKWLVNISQHTHPILGKATAAVTMIEGGIRFNMIPETCKAVADVRILPGQTPERVIAELEDLLSPLRNEKKMNYRIHTQYHQPALYTNPADPLVINLLHAAQEVTGSSEAVGLPYFADSSQFARNGADCVLLGPGDIAQAHGANEYLEIEQLHQTAEILLRFFQPG
jgi:acetylornithine deacetylase/succinyl-diaminopimelate desuccinylase family protein